MKTAIGNDGILCNLIQMNQIFSLWSSEYNQILQLLPKNFIEFYDFLRRQMFVIYISHQEIAILHILTDRSSSVRHQLWYECTKKRTTKTLVHLIYTCRVKKKIYNYKYMGNIYPMNVDMIWYCLLFF